MNNFSIFFSNQFNVYHLETPTLNGQNSLGSQVDTLFEETYLGYCNVSHNTSNCSLLRVY